MTRQREIEYSGQFQKDVKKVQKRNKDMNKLKTLMTFLINGDLQLPSVYKDHPLQGNFKGHRDAHIEPDWLLIYKITDDLLRFARTGAHTDLFGR
ncbi:type II toxin-antitoxin system YafQ family toxin [Salmonella enterica]|nr:type II toxin-antitoxin system YafQ family toxin [Salmonella enterica]